ncbi:MULTISPECIES: class I ribonucleotide reductase maintenance protein YfaE [Psychromonas]|uniref:class I ribonucleotide reductase maintenance protein YfaE n=1 Tax=Psychromonas TaxID=67572 RepID=UPI000A04DBF0|nr:MULTISPECIES: class I ribonucleotide reductase maintenance protein YfaE [Psychromonas]MBB1274529.1 2Fe-2S iron-sulfur cluster binding domain-containing protein [Psychromonas sp. SR45-3]
MSSTLTYNGKPYTLDPNKTLLENLESQAVSVEFHCRDGHCGACRSILLEGKPDYSSFPLAYLKDDEILLCCSKSETNISIKSQ